MELRSFMNPQREPEEIGSGWGSEKLEKKEARGGEGTGLPKLLAVNGEPRRLRSNNLQSVERFRDFCPPRVRKSLDAAP